MLIKRRLPGLGSVVLLALCGGMAASCAAEDGELFEAGTGGSGGAPGGGRAGAPISGGSGGSHAVAGESGTGGAEPSPQSDAGAGGAEPIPPSDGGAAGADPVPAEGGSGGAEPAPPGDGGSGGAEPTTPSDGGLGGAEGGASQGGAAEGGSGGATDAPTPLGKACTVASDCGEGEWLCVDANQDFAEGLGSPAGGLCSHECTNDSDCVAIDPNAFCLTASPEVGHCIKGCRLGTQTPDQKCHSRRDVACQALRDLERVCEFDSDCLSGEQCVDSACGSVGCLPQCTSDTECPNGRFCDVFWGLCVAEPYPDPTFGNGCSTAAPCTPYATCLHIMDSEGVDVTAFCSQPCVLGQACGQGAGSCVLQDHGFESDLGDIAYCAPTCECNDDCAAPGLACVAGGAVDGQQGACMYPFDGEGDPLPTVPCPPPVSGEAGATSTRATP
ncbi:MAG TPA: hypothetical protein VER33_15905 [Polyangiaceae bacterium]|nr:hypothetical protein [Polyangiaceae bacterium]